MASTKLSDQCTHVSLLYPVNQVYELWDFDQDYPDSPEDEDMVEEESTPHPYGQQSGFSTSDRGQTVQGPSASQAIDVVMLDGD